MTNLVPPKRSVIIYDLPEDLVLNTHYALVTGDVDLVELFKAKKSESSFVLEHEDAVQNWLSFICGQREDNAVIRYPFQDKVLSKKLNHILWVLPSKESCQALSTLLQTSEVSDIRANYMVLNYGDPDCDTPEKINAQIEDIVNNEHEVKKTLTLISKSSVLDVKCQYWSAVFMLCNFGSNSASEFFQIAESVQLPWWNEESNMKRDSYIFSFSSKRALYFINDLFKKDYFSRYFSEDVDSLKKHIRERLRDLAVEFWSTDGKVPIDEDYIYEVNPNESRSLWKSRRLINESTLKEFLDDKAHKKAFHITGRINDEKFEKVIELIKDICSRIPTYLFLMERKDISLVDHLKESLVGVSNSKKKPGSSRKNLSSSDKAAFDLIDFEAIVHIKPELFLNIASSGVLYSDAIDRLACKFRASEIIPYISSASDKVRSFCPHNVGLIFNSMPWTDFKYQYREVDRWDQLLDVLSSPENENEDSIKTLTMLLCYLQLLKPALEEGDNSFEVDFESLKEQILRVVSVKEDPDELMNDFRRIDRYDLWDFPDPSKVKVTYQYQEKVLDLDYLNHLIANVRLRSEKVIDHYNSSHSFNRYQKANEPYYSDDKTILLNVPQGEEEYIIEDGTIVIGRNAFLNCSKLTKITFPKSIQIIEEGAFNGCKELELIVFPDTNQDYWQDVFNRQIKKVAFNSFYGSGIEQQNKGFFEKQYKNKPFFYQSSGIADSIKVWCVDENGYFLDSTGGKFKVTEDEENICLHCIHSNFDDNESILKTTVRTFLKQVQSDSEHFYDVAPLYLDGTEKDIDERKRQIAFLFCATRTINAIQIGNLRFDEDLYKLIGKVMDERVSKSSVGGTIYLSFDINSAELNNPEFADFLKVYYGKRDNVKSDLVNFCHKHNIGMTFYPNTGVFIDEEEKNPDNRMKVEENSYTIKIIYVSSSKLDSIAEELCKTYYQQSVLVEDEINNRAYFKKHPLVQPNMDTLERDNSVLFQAYKEYHAEHGGTNPE